MVALNQEEVGGGEEKKKKKQEERMRLYCEAPELVSGEAWSGLEMSEMVML